MPDEVEKVAMGSPDAVQVVFPHTWKVMVPVSLSSWSLNVAVRLGVAVARGEPSAGVTSAGTSGDWLPVLFVIDTFASVAVAAAFPLGVARSRIFAAPGW